MLGGISEMRTQEDYEFVRAVIRQIIHQWDPFSLLQEGAPDDEFESEVSSLLAYIPKIRTTADATRAISSVFSESFEANQFTEEACADVGAKLFEALVAHKVVVAA